MRAYETLLARVTDDLAAGRLRLGDRLPGERQLADDLAISRTSVREGVRVLEALGVVRTAPGSGSSAGAVVVGEVSDALGLALRLHLSTGALPVEDVVELRVLLESWVVTTLAGQAGAPGELDAVLDTMDVEADPHRFLRLDASFHVGLARATGNAALGAVMASLRVAVEQYVIDELPAEPAWPGTAQRLQREHRGVLAAVRAGDAALAASRVREHILGYHRPGRAVSEQPREHAGPRTQAVRSSSAGARRAIDDSRTTSTGS